MQVFENILDAIGRTPLVRLNRVAPKGGAQVLAKCEYMNPAGSIKDRMALHIIQEAEKAGLLKPGGTIVENTSGNTGMGVAMVAAVRGYRCVFTIPDKMSQEKIDSLKAFGAEVIVTPTDVPGDSPEHYVMVAKRIANETPGAFYLDQYHNEKNIEAHELTTAQEVWDETDGKFDVFVAGPGTGGTISGVGRFLKKRAPHIKVIGADPIGSVHYGLFHTGTIPTAHVYKVEGVGDDIECRALDLDVIDDMFQVTDKESFHMARRLVREEGLFCGGSSGTLVHIAVEVAKQLTPDKTVVTVLPDSAARYISKHLNDEWMKDYGFMEDGPDLGSVGDLLNGHAGRVVTAKTGSPVSQIIKTFKEHGISQIPVVDDRGRPVQMVHEVDVLRGLHEGTISGETSVQSIATPIGGVIPPTARVEELYRIFETDQVAVVVDGGQPVGIISQIDLIEFLSSR